MAFIEMLSDASLLNVLIEMLIIEILRGNVPHFQLQESAKKSKASPENHKVARFQVFSPFQLFLEILRVLLCFQRLL